MNSLFAIGLRLFLAAFGQALESWLRARQQEADAEEVGALTAALTASQAENDMLVESQSFEANTHAMTDYEATQEAMKWAAKSS